MSGSRPQIAIVTDAIAPYHRGGKEQRYDELAPRLTQYADVHVYTMKWWRGGATTTRGGVSYHAICPFMPLYRGERRSVAQALVFAIACLRLMFARFDVIDADHMPYLQLFPLKLVALVRRKRLAVTWHEVWDREQWRRYLGRAGLVAWWLEQVAMRLPDCVIAASAETAERLSGRVPHHIPIVVAPNGIDLELASGTPAASELVDVVSVGRMLSHKRFDLLLESVALLARAGKTVTCRIVGDGPERSSLVAQSRRLGISHLVDFRHDVHSHVELLSLLKGSRMFVSASEREGFGIAALEAIGCGVPVITTNAPHNLARHLVNRSSRGVICDATAEALAAAIDSVSATVADADLELDRDWLREYDWNAIAGRVASVLAPGSVAAHDAASGPVAAAAQREAVAPGPGVRIPRLLPPIAGAAESAPTATEEPEPAPPEPHATPALDGRGGPPGSAGVRARVLDLLASLAAVGALAGLANVRGVWILQAAELLLLLTVPGLLLLRALRAAPEAITSFPIYIVCASLATLMLSGLLVDLIGPGVGVSRPLATVPLTVSISIVCLLLIAASVPAGTPNVAAYLRGSIRSQQLWPLLLPVLAWVGAGRLTNGHGATVAVIGVAVIGVALLAGAMRAERWKVSHSAILLYGASLALMWGFSLRGHFIYGFDISGEYQTFIQILHAGRWHVSHHHDAYGAMLSLTILPSSIVGLTGASPLLVLKAIFPLLFALFPVAVFLLASRLLTIRFAYLAALFIVVQDYMFQQLPAIARQEIALLFFVCVVAAIFDPRLRPTARLRVAGVFAAGLVLSHYGTTYLTITLFAIALGAELVRGALGSRPHRERLVPVAGTLAIIGAIAAIWYVPVTDSAQNVSQFVSDLNSKGISVLPNAGGRDILHSYLAGNVATKVSASRFAQLAQNDFAKNRPYVHTLPQASQPTFALHDATVRGQTIRSHPVVRIMDTEQVIVSQLTILLAALGSVLLWLRLDAEESGRGFAMLGVGTLVVLVAIRFSGTAANDYNQTRAFLQAMVPLSICLAWLLQLFSRRRRFGRAIPAVFVAALAGVFLTTSGLTAIAAGGGARTNLADHGEDFERYYVVTPELAAARWLNAVAPQGEIVSSDRYGQLRILAATGRINAVLPVVTPQTLDLHAWIYADATNFVRGRTRGQEGSNYALYDWPGFVERFWNLVYSNGSAGVYARTH